jgi:hypothetical protein
VQESFDVVVRRWSEEKWDLEMFHKITGDINKTLISIGHGSSQVGITLAKLWTFMDQMMLSFGLIMTDNEMQTDFIALLEEENLDALQAIKVEINGSTAAIVNLKELKKTSDPEAARRARTKKSFDDFMPTSGTDQSRNLSESAYSEFDEM